MGCSQDFQSELKLGKYFHSRQNPRRGGEHMG